MVHHMMRQIVPHMVPQVIITWSKEEARDLHRRVVPAATATATPYNYPVPVLQLLPLPLPWYPHNIPLITSSSTISRTPFLPLLFLLPLLPEYHPHCTPR